MANSSDYFFRIDYLPYNWSAYKETLQDPKWKSLSSLKLEGVKGISGSSQILRHFGDNSLGARSPNTVLKMAKTSLLKANDLVEFDYENPNLIFASGLLLLRRLYQIEAGENELWTLFKAIWDRVYSSPSILLRSGVPRAVMIEAFVDIFFPLRQIQTPLDFVRKAISLLRTLKSRKPNLSFDLESAVDFITTHENQIAQEVAEAGVSLAKTYAWESEWEVKGAVLKVPKGSVLYLPKPDVKAYPSDLFNLWRDKYKAAATSDLLYEYVLKGKLDSEIYFEMDSYLFDFGKTMFFERAVKDLNLASKYRLKYVDADKLRQAGLQMIRRHAK